MEIDRINPYASLLGKFPSWTFAEFPKSNLNIFNHDHQAIEYLEYLKNKNIPVIIAMRTRHEVKLLSDTVISVLSINGAVTTSLVYPSM